MRPPFPVLFFIIAIAAAVGLMFWAMGQTHGPTRDTSYQGSNTTGQTPKTPGVPLPPEGSPAPNK